MDILYFGLWSNTIRFLFFLAPNFPALAIGVLQVAPVSLKYSMDAVFVFQQFLIYSAAMARSIL